jgi:hypothetical protein
MANALTFPNILKLISLLGQPDLDKMKPNLDKFSCETRHKDKPSLYTGLVTSYLTYKKQARVFNIASRAA